MLDRFTILDQLWLVTKPVGVPVYDFDFRQFFECRTPYTAPDKLSGIARIGAFEDYPAFYEQCLNWNIHLVHSPADHLRCTTLPSWYPLVQKDTPRSRWFSEIPTFSEIESEFEMPVFIKGSRQTSKHSAAASIVRNRAEFENAAEIFQGDPILRWQDFVCREFIALRKVSGAADERIPPSFEFRTFWWRGELVGSGRYWYEAEDYNWKDEERQEALKVAQRAVDAIGCTFLVIDLAQTVEGKWIVIECNDAMESGYAGASPFSIWQAIVDFESQTE